MPNPDEIAVITALGSMYSSWESVSFERRIGDVVSRCRLRVIEIGSTGKGWATLRLKLNDKPVTVTLAGRTVMSDGFISVRQGALVKDQHLIEVIASSRTLRLVVATAKPQQFKNSSLQQIANALVAPFGIGFKMMGGNLAGADKKFERMSVHPGESCFDTIHRLCKMRDVHLSDDASGNLTVQRANTNAAMAGELAEGQNILSIRAVMSVDDTGAPLTVYGQNFGTDQRHGDPARDVSATAQNPDYPGYAPIMMFAEMPGDKQDMAMRANHEVAYTVARQIECYVTVPGWLRPDGTLWVEHLAEQVTIRSPSIFPVDSISLAIRGVKHEQNNENGTTTTIELCLPNALSAGGQIGPGTDVTPYQPAQPDAGDQ
jgi:prophage tail gpP-like protein